MNWRLIFQLSLFGLVMGVGTVFLISSTVEPFCWLIVFLISAYLIATRCADRYFVHGLLVGIANSIWVTGSHVLLFQQYIARHPAELSMMASMPLPTHPRVVMLLMGPLIGVVSGIILGAFAVVAHKLVGARQRSPVTTS